MGDTERACLLTGTVSPIVGNDVVVHRDVGVGRERPGDVPGGWLGAVLASPLRSTATAIPAPGERLCRWR